MNLFASGQCLKEFSLARNYRFSQINGPKLLPPANEVWGKVMFLHLSICLGEGGVSVGVCIQGESASRGVCIQRRGLHPGEVCLQGGSGSGRSLHPVGSASEGGLPTPHPRGGGESATTPELEKRAVRILLECFLV